MMNARESTSMATVFVTPEISKMDSQVQLAPGREGHWDALIA